MVKSAIFEVGEPLEMGPDSRKFRKKKQNRKIIRFLGD